LEVGNRSFDLAVIGGGPAGSSAAIVAARSGARVGLFEAGGFPRQKVCGEFVSAESLQLLRELLRDDPYASDLLRESPVISETRLFFGRRVVQTRITPPALSIPRRRLDSVLWEAAQRANVCAYGNCEVLSIAGNGPFSLVTAQGTFEAKALIVCAGRWSRFSHADLPVGPKWIGVKAHYRECNPPLSTDLYFFDHGYCGVQPVSKDVINVCAMVRSDRANAMQQVFRLSPELQQRAAKWELRTPAVSTAPLLYRQPRAALENALLAGDAAGFIDPFAGDGISMALRTGEAAALCLQAFVKGEVSLHAAVAEYEAIYQRQFAPLIGVAASLRRVLELPHRARAIAFQALRFPGVLRYVIRRTRTA